MPTRLSHLLRVACGAALLAAAPPAPAQEQPPSSSPAVMLDFVNVPLAELVNQMAGILQIPVAAAVPLPGRATIVSEGPIPRAQARAMFRQLLALKGLALAETPGGGLTVIRREPPVPQQR